MPAPLALAERAARIEAGINVDERNEAFTTAAEWFGKPWLRDPCWPLAWRYRIALALPCGERLR